MDELFAVNILQTLCNMTKYSSQLGLIELGSCSSVFFNFPLKTTAFTVFVLNVNLRRTHLCKELETNLITYRSILHPAIVISDDMFVFHKSSVSKHFIHGHLLIMTILPDLLLGYLDGIDHSIQTVTSFLHNTKFSTRYFSKLQKLFLVSN